MNDQAYKRYLLGVLLLIYAFNGVDRLALGLLMQNIKTDLHLSDTELGFLTGIAFALFYSLMGIPLARWADRGNRVRLISVTTALWSVAVALCGLAGNFLQLLSMRIFVAVGEAGCVPPAHSLIADYFGRAERPRAVSMYMLGTSLSGVIGYFLAGWLNEFYGWRTTFLLLGTPGVGLAGLAWLTLAEPRRRSFNAAAPGADPVRPRLTVVCVTLWSNKTFRQLLLCYSVMSFFGAGIGQWQPTYMTRSFQLQTGELGIWFALVYGISGIAGIYLGGELAARRAANNERLQLSVMAIACFVSTGLAALTYLSPNRHVVFGLMGLTAVGGAAIIGPLFATIQTLVPECMRATAIALIYLFANLIGMGLGPLAAGALSDALHPYFGAESLRYSLLVLSSGYMWGAWHLWRARTTVTDDVAASQAIRQIKGRDERAPFYMEQRGVGE
jgi:MFS family permease